jgi:hypothetical protein
MKPRTLNVGLADLGLTVTNGGSEPEAAVLKSRPSLMRQEDRLADPRVALQVNFDCGQSLWPQRGYGNVDSFLAIDALNSAVSDRHERLIAKPSDSSAIRQYGDPVAQTDRPFAFKICLVGVNQAVR